MSGASGTIVTSPLEFLKTRLQVEELFTCNPPIISLSVVQSTTGQQFVTGSTGRNFISPSRVKLSTSNGSITVVKYFG